MHRFIRDNALSLVLFSLFLSTLVGLTLTGHIQSNQELSEHGQTAISYIDYITSGQFVEAVFENWESEFLQMGALVILTIWLHQKGSADSKKLKGKEAVDTSSRYSIIHASTWKRRKHALHGLWYDNSLSIALFGLFLISFVLHAWGGVNAHNADALQHNESTQTIWQYFGSAQFWYESFQNWQSEFLSVAALIVLSIFLRQRHSPESKPIGQPNSRTGAE